MDGREKSLMDSVAMTMAMTPGAEVAFVADYSRHKHLLEYLRNFFSHEDSLPKISLQSNSQLILDNGAMSSFLNSGRSLRGRRPVLVVVDEEREDANAYACGASVIVLNREDFGVA